MSTFHRPSFAAGRFVGRFAVRAAIAIALSAFVLGASSASARGVVAVDVRERNPFHLRLTKSEPGTNAELAAAPTVIRLWYSLRPEMAVTTVKLADADGNAITLGAPRRGAAAAAPVEVDVKQPLAPGRYVVAWKTSSSDGHPVRGDFAFTIKAAE